MASLHSIFQDIALIISDNSDNEILQERIRNNTLDWEKIVPVASKHLIIPLIYFKLKDKGHLNLLPKDLQSYLKEIARQNTERNTTILKEVNEIGLLLNSENIDHVFLKGAAMLAADIYANKGERMIGDIDILVHAEQLSIAQELLIRNGYSAIETTFGQKYIEHKHLDRLIPNNKLGAVEIHRKLLYKPVKKILNPTILLNSKLYANGVSVPNVKNLLIHTILNFEINDYGYYYNYLGFRNSYDALILFEKINHKDLHDLFDNKYIVSFFSKVSIYFNVKSLNQSTNFKGYRNRLFLLKQESKYIFNVLFRLLSVVHFFDILTNRVCLFYRNKNYRKDAWNDRKRIIQLLKKGI